VAPLCRWQGTELADPAIGSAGVSGKQARFDGSDRQARGRLMKALSDGPVPRARAAVIMQREAGTAERLVGDLVRDGLCEIDGLSIRLPG
jgi:A/G-specific adenine glycosylase